MRRDHSGRASSHEEGFSVIELLIAASIVAVALLAIASMAPIGYGNVDRSGERTTTTVLAQQRIEWLRNQAYASAALAAGTTTESSIAGYPGGYTRTTAIQDNTPVSGVKQVTVTVTMPTVSGNVQLTALIAK